MALPNTTNVTRPRSLGYGLRLDEQLYRLVVTPETPIQTKTVEPNPQRINTNENAEDFLPSVGQLFSRSEFQGGEGLAFAHRPTNTEEDRTRFWDSEGINVAQTKLGVPPQIKLSFQSTRVDTTSQQYLAETSNGFVWSTPESGSNINRIENPTSTPVTLNSEAVGGGAIVGSVAILNDLPYVAATNGVYGRSTNVTVGAWSQFSTKPTSRIWNVKERLIGKGYELGGDGHSLYEIRSGADSVLLHALDSNYEWMDVAEFSGGLLAVASDGHLYMFTFETDEATFDLTLNSRTKFEGEIPVSIGCLYDTVLIGTILPNTGTLPYMKGAGKLYAGIVQDFSINLKLIKQIGETADLTHYIPLEIYGTGNNFYIGVEDPSRNKGDIWRYDITNGALSRYIYYTMGAGATTYDGIHSILMIRGKLLYTVVEAAGARGIYRESYNAVTSGYMILPLIDFYNAYNKAWVSVRVDGIFPTSWDIEVYFSTNPDAILDSDHVSWTLLDTWDSSSDPAEVRFPNGTSSRYMAIKIKFVDNSGGHGEVALRSITVRSYQGPNDLRIRVPVNVSNVINIPGRRRIRTRRLGRQIHEQLKTMFGQDVEAELYEPKIKILGVVEDVDMQVTRLFHRGVASSIAYVTVLGSKIS